MGRNKYISKQLCIHFRVSSLTLHFHYVIFFAFKLCLFRKKIVLITKRFIITYRITRPGSSSTGYLLEIRQSWVDPTNSSWHSRYTSGYWPLGDWCPYRCLQELDSSWGLAQHFGHHGSNLLVLRRWMYWQAPHCWLWCLRQKWPLISMKYVYFSRLLCLEITLKKNISYFVRSNAWW